MIDVYWLEQTETDVPVDNDWLGATEAIRLNRLHVAKRRTDWRLGRWTAKHAVAAYLNMPADRGTLSRIEIQSAPSGAPEVFLSDQPAQVSISISHRAGIAVCAVTECGAPLGCDLEMVEPRSNAFVADYFTPEEQALVAAAPADRYDTLALLWSGKESALKALREGLRLDTRSVTVRPTGVFCQAERDRKGVQPPVRPKSADGGKGWRPLQVRYVGGRYVGGQVFHGWWQQVGNLVRTLVATPAPTVPIHLSCPTDSPPTSPRQLAASSWTC